MNPTRTLLRKRDARGRIGIGDTLFDTLVREGVLPRPIYLTDSNRLPLWDSEELDAFIREKLDARSADAGRHDRARVLAKRTSAMSHQKQ
jgi:predicted DNA-binding transcriptional regulator AlpA